MTSLCTLHLAEHVQFRLCVQNANNLITITNHSNSFDWRITNPHDLLLVKLQREF